MGSEPQPLYAPWLRHDLLPEKTHESPYGYLAGKEQIGCSQEKLIERCRETTAPLVVAAWAPESDRVVTVHELPFLFDALQHRARAAIYTGMRWAVLGLLIYLPILLENGFGGRRFEQYSLLLLSFAVIPLAHGCWQLWELKRETPEKAAQEARSLRYGMWLQSRRKPITRLLLGLIGVVFLVQLLDGMEQSIQLAGLTKGPFSWNEAYRFLSATLMHGGVAHVVMNAAALLVLGTMAEALLGKMGLALTFTVSALGGSILSYLCLTATSVGASGGIMGLIGCLAVVGYHFRGVLPAKFGRQMIVSIILMAVLGFIARNVMDNAAHAGGLLTGAGIGWALVLKQTRLPIVPSLTVKLLGGFSLALLGATAVWIAVLVFR